MVPAKMVKALSLALLTAALWTVPVSDQTTGPAHAQDGNGPAANGGPNPEAMNMDDLRALVIDLAGYHACDRLQGRILTLSSEGAASPADRRTVTGNFWIDACDTRQVDQQHLRVAVSGYGWRWISRQRKSLGAQFELDEYVKFSADVSMVGTFDVAYARSDRIATVWFVPTRPVEVDFQVLGDVDVETESLWSSIVGQGADIVGESPAERAQEDIRKKGTRRFRSRLSSGITLIVDLCSGQLYTKFGTFPAGQIPEQDSRSESRPLLADNHAVLHQGGILMSGPFDTDDPVVSLLDVQKGAGVLASMVCQEDAQRIAEAYRKGGNLPDVDTLAEATVRPGSPERLEIPAGTGCPVVLVMMPADTQATPVSFSFTAYHEGAEQEPLVKCE